MKKDNELEMYKRFFRDAKNRIKKQDISVEDKLIITLVDMENMIRCMDGISNKDVYDFIETVRESIKPNIVKPEEIINRPACTEGAISDRGFGELEEEHDYKARPSKPYTFPCQSCTKVDEACIPTVFEGGGCGKCPHYESRVWANILKEKEKKDRVITNKELAMWLAQGKGQVQDRRTGRISTNHYYFEYDDSHVDYINIGVRKWIDNEWHEPEYSYCFGGNK